MQTPTDTEHRLTELEIKASYAEDLLEQLNLVIVRQQRDIDALAREVGQLRQQALTRGTDLPPHALDEVPPHY
ncbi:MAG: SlyX family protein [Rhodoferax sp.]